MALLAFSCALAACTSATRLAEPPTAHEIPALQARLERDSTDLATRLRLATAYRVAGRHDDARGLLEPVAGTQPDAGFHLALVYEELGRWEAVRPLYQNYLERGRNAELKDQVRKRLPLIERRELEAAVRNALAREHELASTAPPPRTVGVFPFLTITQDSALRPLGTALAELLTTDLAQTDRLRVVDRTQVQRLLDELRLAESGRVDPATAARSGRILGASNVVQGRVEGAQTQLSMQAVVVKVPAPPTSPEPIRDRAALDRIFQLEKNLALSLYERMGVQLTAAERQRVTRHATQNVQALLAFGYGLEAADAGRYPDAYRHFQRALQLDPNFAPAQAGMADASRLGFAAAMDVDALVRMAMDDDATTSNASAERVSRLRLFETIQMLVPNLLTRDPAAELVGAEGTTRNGRVDLIIRRPGGSQ
jgi:tetratricopeptide (TPR) repeat protein